jgi:hypothetical protein
MQLRKSDEARQAGREQREREKVLAAAQEKLAADERKRLADQERERKQALRAARSARLTATTRLRWLDVAVRDGQVYKLDFAVAAGRAEGHLLGELAGAHAEVTGGRAGHRRSGVVRTADAAVAASIVGPVGLLAGTSRKGTRGTAFVVFADGSLYEKKLADDASLVRAQADAVRFNALAVAAGVRAPENATATAEDGSLQDAEAEIGQLAAPDTERRQPAADQAHHRGLTDELTRLASLHESGALTDAEFQAAKAQLLGT